MKKVLVIAPHPDDETLGCGGTILKHKDDNDEVSCIFVTGIKKNSKQYKKRNNEIKKINSYYSFNNLILGKFEPSKLDKYEKKKIIDFISKVIKKLKPEIIYVPFREDAHSDHRVVYDCVSPVFKTFRYPFVKSVRIYETLSETNFKSNISKENFEPNLWIDISKYLKQKIEIMKIYKSEIKKHPFPRSEKSIRALAILRGSYSGHKFSEAFKILKQIDD